VHEGGNLKICKRYPAGTKTSLFSGQGGGRKKGGVEDTKKGEGMQLSGPDFEALSGPRAENANDRGGRKGVSKAGRLVGGKGAKEKKLAKEITLKGDQARTLRIREKSGQKGPPRKKGPVRGEGLTLLLLFEQAGGA